MCSSIDSHKPTLTLLFVALTALGASMASGCGDSDFESRTGSVGSAGGDVNSSSSTGGSAGDAGAGGEGGTVSSSGAGGAGGSGGSGASSSAGGAGGSGGLASIGMPCGDNAACLSGHCVDGICCDTACDGACMACSAAFTGATEGTCSPVLQGTDPSNECEPASPTTCGNSTGACDGAGACEKHPSGTICGPAALCVNASQTSAGACDGHGVCLSGITTSCLPYVCGATSCLTTCADDSSCAAGYYCAGTTCTAKKPDGQVCNAANECQSGACNTFFGDVDADGYGNPATTIQACSTPPMGYVTNNSDCNDSNATSHPGAAETCWNGIDENCNGTVDDPAACCVPYNGQYDQTVIQGSTTGTYVYHNDWCIVGSGLPPGCYAGYLIQSQWLAEAHCIAGGSSGQCTDPDALWSITCNNAVHCVYQCDGQCIPLSC